MEERQRALDACNAYMVSIWGASPDIYCILKDASIADEFSRMLSASSPPPRNNCGDHIQSMTPFRGLKPDNAYTSWMSDFVRDDDSRSIDDDTRLESALHHCQRQAAHPQMPLSEPSPASIFPASQKVQKRKPRSSAVTEATTGPKKNPYF